MRHWTDKQPGKSGLEVKLLHPDAIVPTRGTPGSAGLDIYSLRDQVVRSGDIVIFETGIALAIPSGFCGLLCTRSSMGVRGVRLAAGMNVIDSDYRGELKVVIRNDGMYDWKVHKGDRIAQLVITPYAMLNMVMVDNLPPSDRGTGGFGSTGR